MRSGERIRRKTERKASNIWGGGIFNDTAATLVCSELGVLWDNFVDVKGYLDSVKLRIGNK